MCDGLKPSQRKILFTVLEKGIDNKHVKEVKVIGLSSIVQDRTNYIHGEISLQEAIVKMAQIFVGSNNINTLYPGGQFGTRTQGGENSSSPRYIFTYLGDLTRKLFKKEDEQVYKYLIEENKVVEPETFAPIIPMVLVNGAHGIGTGFSTHVPCYNPKDIVNNIMRLMDDETPKTMKPWYRGFIGTITKKNDYTYISHGVYEIPENGDTVAKITELPVGVWTDDYKMFLDKISDEKNDKIIDDYQSNSGSNFVDFKLSFSGHSLQNMIKHQTLEQKLKLTSSISTSNMYLYNADGKMTKYDTADDILEAFYDFRLSMYEKRKEYYLKLLKNELDILNYKIKFIRMVCDEKIIIAKRSRANIIEQLEKNKFPKLSHDINAVDTNDQPTNDTDDANVATKVAFKTYDYITKLSLFSISEDEIDELEKQQRAKKEEYETYKKLTAKDIWKIELNDFTEAYDKWYEKQEELDKIANFEKPSNKKTKKHKTSKTDD
jgi:DNA topoisomerase-2